MLLAAGRSLLLPCSATSGQHRGEEDEGVEEEDVEEEEAREGGMDTGTGMGQGKVPNASRHSTETGSEASVGVDRSAESASSHSPFNEDDVDEDEDAMLAR